MIKKAATLLFVIVLLSEAEGRCESNGDVFRPLLEQDSIAQVSRLKLAGILYQKGVESEGSGNLAEALRYWLNAYNLDDSNKVFLRRVIDCYRVMKRLAGKAYLDALFDLEYGRKEGAAERMRYSREIMGGIDTKAMAYALADREDATEPQGPPKPLAWAQMEGLGRVEELISAGDTGGARILLDALLEARPDWKEAREIYGRLNKDSKDHPEQPGDADRKMLELANDLWFEFNQLKGEGDFPEARKKIMALKGLYNDVDVKPAFLASLNSEAEEVEKLVEGSLKERFATVRDGLSQAGQVDWPAGKLAKLSGLYRELEAILQEYSGLDTAELLLGDVLGEMKRCGRIALAQASTLKRLEGCKAAMPALKQLLQAMPQPEFSEYQEAKRELESCEE